MNLVMGQGSRNTWNSHVCHYDKWHRHVGYAGFRGFQLLGLIVLFAGSESCFVVILEKEVEMDLRWKSKFSLYALPMWDTARIQLVGWTYLSNRYGACLRESTNCVFSTTNSWVPFKEVVEMWKRLPQALHTGRRSTSSATPLTLPWSTFRLETACISR